MKNVFLFCLVLLLCLQGFSQYPFTTVFPLGVSDSMFGDTLLNSRIILEREHIRKVTALQTSNTDKHSWITEYLITDGRIDERKWCHRRPQDVDTAWCNNDTVLYDHLGRLTEYKARDGRGNIYILGKTEYTSQGSAESSWVARVPQDGTSDTISYQYRYNEKGQLIRQEQDEKNKMPVNASLYYNEDGLLDSIQHDSPQWGTYVFKRRQKGKNKVIELDTRTSEYRWVYNASGQCLSSKWAFKHPTVSRNNIKQRLSAEIRYYYNGDGTLAKVVEERSGDRINTTRYSYEK